MFRSGLVAGSALLAIAALLAVNTSSAEAHVASGPGCSAPAPACEPVCCKTYNPCIKYCDRRCRRSCCDSCAPMQKLVLHVQDPCCCKCAVDVPVCIPACCEGEPCVTDRCGILKGVVWYKWDCGFKLRVEIARCGDLTVTYYGR